MLHQGVCSGHIYIIVFMYVYPLMALMLLLMMMLLMLMMLVLVLMMVLMLILILMGIPLIEVRLLDQVLTSRFNLRGHQRLIEIIIDNLFALLFIFRILNFQLGLSSLWLG